MSEKDTLSFKGSVTGQFNVRGRPDAVIAVICIAGLIVIALANPQQALANSSVLSAIAVVAVLLPMNRSAKDRYAARKRKSGLA